MESVVVVVAALAMLGVTIETLRWHLSPNARRRRRLRQIGRSR